VCVPHLSYLPTCGIIYDASSGVLRWPKVRQTDISKVLLEYRKLTF
jgi:hypothetical protein